MCMLPVSVRLCVRLRVLIYVVVVHCPALFNATLHYVSILQHIGVYDAQPKCNSR